MAKKTLAEKLELLMKPEIEDKHRKAFERQARYVGNGLYGVPECNIYIQVIPVSWR